MPFCISNVWPFSCLHRTRNNPAHISRSPAFIHGLCWLVCFLLVQVIEVKFEKLDLEPDMYCRYDYVALFNGGERDNSRRIGKFCGDRSPG